MIEVKRLVNAGSSVSGAIRETLKQRGLTVTAFADKYGRNRQNMSAIISGSRAPTEDDLAAFVTEFGATQHEWRMLLWEHSKPVAAA